MEYTEITLSEDIINAVETTLTLSPGESIGLNLAYSTEIANAWIESDNASIRLTNFNSGIDACKVTATNIGGGYGTAKIKVIGNAIVENSCSVTVRKENNEMKKFKKSAEFTNAMTDFLVQATVKNWTVTFRFANGY